MFGNSDMVKVLEEKPPAAPPPKKRGGEGRRPQYYDVLLINPDRTRREQDVGVLRKAFNITEFDAEVCLAISIFAGKMPMILKTSFEIASEKVEEASFFAVTETAFCEDTRDLEFVCERHLGD